MPSVVIAAHNEETVLGACLESLLHQGCDADEIVVVANGCTDGTAAVAEKYGIRLIVLPRAGKAAALNAGDAVVRSFPRIYLDADIVVPDNGVAGLLAGFGEGVLAVVPRRRMDVSGRPWPVRAYFSINERLPAFHAGLFGRGMIAVSSAGRSRFATFPDMVADDLFLDAQFVATEKHEVEGVTILVETPHTVRSLVKRLVRVRRGNSQLRAVAADELAVEVAGADRWSWMRDVVAPRPRLWLNAVPYVTITIIAAVLSRRTAGSDTWGRDDSTRVASPPPPGGL